MALRAVDSAKSAATVWSRQRNLSSIRLRLPEERLPVREARICPGVAPIRRTPSFRQLGQPFDSKRSVEARRSRRRIAPGSRKSQEPARAQRTHNGLARWTGNCGGRRGVYRRTWFSRLRAWRPIVSCFSASGLTHRERGSTCSICEGFHLLFAQNPMAG